MSNKLFLKIETYFDITKKIEQIKLTSKLDYLVLNYFVYKIIN